MDLQLAAELISSFAALVTVVMAVMELYSRGSSKKSENAVDVYAEYLRPFGDVHFLVLFSST